mmetsp:Transcript_2197/g.6555  ORF Transcript_2197/g.6555 Transcript_2197/m.6555 type:complete len:229 (-) Transcript_2197:552-1238(-)
MAAPFKRRRGPRWSSSTAPPCGCSATSSAPTGRPSCRPSCRRCWSCGRDSTPSRRASGMRRRTVMALTCRTETTRTRLAAWPPCSRRPGRRTPSPSPPGRRHGRGGLCRRCWMWRRTRTPRWLLSASTSGTASAACSAPASGTILLRQAQTAAQQPPTTTSVRCTGSWWRLWRGGCALRTASTSGTATSGRTLTSCAMMSATLCWTQPMSYQGSAPLSCWQNRCRSSW